VKLRLGTVNAPESDSVDGTMTWALTSYVKSAMNITDEQALLLGLLSAH
jgi:hypothetical protein